MNEVVILIEECDFFKLIFLYLSYVVLYLLNEVLEEVIVEYVFVENEYRRVYVVMVLEIDFGIVKLVDVLESEGEFDNMLIWFMSDNGGFVLFIDIISGFIGMMYWLKCWFGIFILIKIFEFLCLNYDYVGSDNIFFCDGKLFVYEGGVWVLLFIYWKDGLLIRKVEGCIIV